MTPLAFLLVLASAALHATWNAIVLVAMVFVTNVAYVQAFRQIGLLFGLAEGAFLLGERCTAPKVAGTLLILGGLAASVL